MLKSVFVSPASPDSASNVATVTMLQQTVRRSGTGLDESEKDSQKNSKNLVEFNLEMLLIEYHCKHVSDFLVYFNIIVNYGNYQFNVRRYYKPPK